MENKNIENINNDNENLKENDIGVAANIDTNTINNSNKTKAWDVAAPEILFMEAGGLMSDITGVDFCYDPTNYKHKHGVMAIASKSLYDKIIPMTRKVYEE